MKQRLIFALGALLLIGGLAACQSATPSVVPPMATSPRATLTPIPQPTSTPKPLVGTIATPNAGPRRIAEAVPLEPTPILPWQVPEVSDTDWAKGGEETRFVLVEYADYQ